MRERDGKGEDGDGMGWATGMGGCGEMEDGRDEDLSLVASPGELSQHSLYALEMETAQETRT